MHTYLRLCLSLIYDKGQNLFPSKPKFYLKVFRLGSKERCVLVFEASNQNGLVEEIKLSTMTSSSSAGSANGTLCSTLYCHCGCSCAVRIMWKSEVNRGRHYYRCANAQVSESPFLLHR